MSSGLNSVEFIPNPFPSRVEVRHAKRGIVTAGSLTPSTDRARSGSEAWFFEMVWNELDRYRAVEMIADLEKWGTLEAFTTLIPGEDLVLAGGAADADLDKLLVTGDTAVGGAASVIFNASAPPTLQTIERSSGSWLTDGFLPGMSVVATNAEDAVNNNTFYIQSVEALKIHLELYSPGIVSNAADTTVVLNGSFDGLGRTLGVYTSPSVASTLMLKKGTFIGWTVNGKYEMARVQEDFTTDSAGKGAVKLSQYIRERPADDATVYTRSVPVRVTLVEDPGYQLGRPILYNFSLRFREEPSAT